MTQKYDRFKAAPWFVEGEKPSVLVGGAGGIGSWLTLLLNRAGFETYVYDFDILEEINMAGQLFMHKSIGMAKVDALAEITRLLCKEEIITNLVKVDENTMTNEIVFSAFDNIKARRDMFTTWVQNYKDNPKAIFVDGRLTAEQLTIFAIKGNDEHAITEYFNNHLPDDSTIPELDCTFKQTSHGAAMIASHMVEIFTNWYAGVLDRDKDRYTPFFWEYIIPIGYQYSRDAEGASSQYDIPPAAKLIEVGILQEWNNPDGLGGIEKTGLSTEEVARIWAEEELQKHNIPFPEGLQLLRPDPMFIPADFYVIDGVIVHKDNPELGKLISEATSVTQSAHISVEEARRIADIRGGRPTILGTIEEITGIGENSIQQAQAEIDRWLGQIENTGMIPVTPTPDNSILEEGTNPPADEEDIDDPLNDFL